MLPRELAIATYSSGQVHADRLNRQQHAQYEQYANQMLMLYRGGIGRTRRDLHCDVHRIFGQEIDCPIRRIDAFCKLLDERATFDRDRRGNAAKLRRQVFRLAAPKHPLVQNADKLFEHNEAATKSEIAAQLGKPWDAIERELFADVIQFHRLAEFEGYQTGAQLLSRYNVAQCQAVLYDAISMTVWANSDFKTILRYAKMARLMHTIRRQNDEEYVFRFDGPASVLRHTRRYGVALAKFLPALLACRDWRMQALIQHPRSAWQNGFRLSAADGLNSHLAAPDEFDSSLEENFAERWGTEPREGWSLIREGEVLYAGQHVCVPDFVFQHQSGRRILMEIVGFWTPEYLAAKRRSLELFRDHQILLAVAESVKSELDNLPPDTIRFKTSLKIADVLERLHQRLESRA